MSLALRGIFYAGGEAEDMSLMENTLFGMKDKTAEALELLCTHEPPEGYYVAYSGGKDSTVILDLVRRSGVKYDAHYNVTTVDPPELVYFIRTQPEIIWDRPEISMWELMVKVGMPPTRIARYCCRYLKERGGLGRTVITGIRAAESVKRSKRQRFETDSKNPAKRYIHLIFDWTTEEVWEYITGNSVPYCPLYNEGFKRLGCICCPMGRPKGQLRDAERWPKYKARYIRAFDDMVKERRLRGLDVAKWQSGQDVWNWWTTRSAQRQCEGQTELFKEARQCRSATK